MFTLPPPPPARNVDTEFKDYVVLKGLHSMHKASLIDYGGVPSLPPENDAVELYNADLEVHLAAYKEWLGTRETLEHLHANLFRFTVWLTNEGTAPAEDIDLEIEFPATLACVLESTSDEAEYLELPDPPTPPERPTQLWADGGFTEMVPVENPSLAEAYSRLPGLYQDMAAVKRLGEDSVFRLTWRGWRLKHHEPAHVGEVIVIMQADAVRPFQANYRIRAANLVRPMTGQLQFVVRRS